MQNWSKFTTNIPIVRSSLWSKVIIEVAHNFLCVAQDMLYFIQQPKILHYVKTTA